MRQHRWSAGCQLYTWWCEPDVTPETLTSTICTRGYAERIRPPTSYTRPLDPANLWPEPYAGDANARQKDVVENYLHRQVCDGNMLLGEAQHLIATDWLGVYRQIRR